MKYLKILFIILVLPILFSCERHYGEDKPETEYFVNQVRSGEYTAMWLPALTYESIPTLLKYAGSEEHITDFPHNLLSSCYQRECRLGIYMLWVVESIRLNSGKRNDGFIDYASQNPLLKKRNPKSDSIEFINIDDDQAHAEVVRAYKNWWNRGRNMLFHMYKHVDPLEKSEYMWH
ncbi:MAG TPA: DUF4943 family protein [Bacteroidales bacterium]|nr:MAG: hypothetical protein BWX62_00123 [Bacteroidetes bacterium ADurb.Bin037]HPV87609.1 DUF4943 family protein [Bacteroidales bacterium]HPW77913.1 DUF4943 family protein [Bacteroidales bacterium]HQB55371.1 DUF4943 family protein [Bacteroidales bacterium]